MRRPYHRAGGPPHARFVAVARTGAAEKLPAPIAAQMVIV